MKCGQENPRETGRQPAHKGSFGQSTAEQRGAQGEGAAALREGPHAERQPSGCHHTHPLPFGGKVGFCSVGRIGATAKLDRVANTLVRYFQDPTSHTHPRPFQVIISRERGIEVSGLPSLDFLTKPLQQPLYSSLISKTIPLQCCQVNLKIYTIPQLLLGKAPLRALHSSQNTCTRAPRSLGWDGALPYHQLREDSPSWAPIFTPSHNVRP